MRTVPLEKTTAVSTGSQDHLEYQSYRPYHDPEYLMGCELLGYDKTTLKGLCTVMNVYIYEPASWGVSLVRKFSTDSGIRVVFPRPIAIHSGLLVRGIFNAVVNGYHLRFNLLIARRGEVFGYG